MIYEKATAEVILFDNSDVVRTSCEKGGWDKGHVCKNTSGDSPDGHWRDKNGLNEWRANRAGL